MGNEETKRIEKLKSDEATHLAKENTRKTEYLARELEIEKSQKAKNASQSEKRSAENIKALAREKARTESYLAQEKKLAEAQEARRLKEKK
jgi:hypothetical protein